MEWFKNLNARPRLMLSFGLLSLLTLVMGCLAISRLNRANDRLVALYQLDLPGIVVIDDLVINRNSIGGLVREAMLNADSVNQVNTTVTQMDQVIQSNSAQTEQLSATAQSFAGESKRLAQLVARFKLGDDGGRSRTGASSVLSRGQQTVKSKRGGPSTVFVQPALSVSPERGVSAHELV